MKVAITVISGLCVGLLMAFNGLTPLLEAKAVWEHRRRVVFSLGLVLAGFTFVMAAILLGTLDLALQYEVQGFILWEAVLSVAVGFLVAGGLCFLTAKWIFPKPEPNALAFIGEQIGLGDIIEEVKRYMEQTTGASTAKPDAPPPRPPESRPDIHHPRGDTGIDSQVGFVH